MTIHEVRAIEAYLRRGGTEQPITPQTFEIGDKSYVVLNGVRESWPSIASCQMAVSSAYFGILWR